MDTTTLLSAIDNSTQAVLHHRREINLAALGLVARRIRADHPSASRLELRFLTDQRTNEDRTVAERVWLPEADGKGRWRACMDDQTRADVAGWCAHIGWDSRTLLPQIWVEDHMTGLLVVDVDAVLAALSG